MRTRIPSNVICLIAGVALILAGSPAAAPIPRAPAIVRAAGVALAEAPTSWMVRAAEIPGVPVPPLMREQFRAEQLYWMQVGVAVGFLAWVAFVVAGKHTRTARGAPIGDALVIRVIAPMSGFAVADALFLLTPGRPPRQ